MTDERKKDAEETQPKQEKQHQKDEREKREKSQSPNPNTPTEKETKPSDDPDSGKSLPRKEPIQQKPASPPAERQVIAVSASKNPAAFFNLARRFLVTDEFCDLSALEGAIVSAVDAAHLLERSKLANIVRIQTSYVTVEPRKKTSPQHSTNVGQSAGAAIGVAAGGAARHHPHSHHPPSQQKYDISDEKKPHQGKRGNPLRRSRIIITVQRTEDYRQWLEENDVDDDHAPAAIS